VNESVYRPTKDEYFIVMAMHAASRASCARRRVGCVLVNKLDHVLSTGMNGPDRGAINCTSVPCAGADSPSGTNLSACEAIHAEVNALLQCSDVQQIRTAYVTTSPCIECTKALLNTSCERIVYLTKYSDGHDSAIEKWRARGRIIQPISECHIEKGYINKFASIYGVEWS
jgi:dCMP deaminase